MGDQDEVEYRCEMTVTLKISALSNGINISDARAKIEAWLNENMDLSLDKEHDKATIIKFQHDYTVSMVKS